MSDLTLESYLYFNKEVEANIASMITRPAPKPRIKFYANGDIHMDSYQTHRRCYPSSTNVKYRLAVQSFDEYIIDKAKRNRAAVKND